LIVLLIGAVAIKQNYMYFPKPAYRNVRCPHCQALSNISFQDGGAYWIAETVWQCPHCKRTGTTTQWQEASRMVLTKKQKEEHLVAGAGI
jgi:phage FluMu protein Com